MKYQGFKPSSNSPPPVIKVKVVDIYMMVLTVNILNLQIFKVHIHKQQCFTAELSH